uniref:Fibronectin type-III domain-containing protein n=1 Tax=Eptatretus burgeri TaxID=7764 RepID=A0A8C4Q5N5_EPTBU
MNGYLILILSLGIWLAVGKGETCNETIKNVEMKRWNLTVCSFNFNHNLKWLPPPMDLSNMKLHVSIKCNECDQWQVVPGCEDVSKTYCDLTHHMSDSFLTYTICVEIIEACSSGIKKWHFRPNEDTVLGPPNVIILNDSVKFHEPRDPNGTRVGYHYSDMSYLVRQSHSTKDEPCNTPEDMIIVKDSYRLPLLKDGEESSDCILVRLYSRSYEKCGQWSEPYCQLVSQPRHWIVGLCTTIVITSCLLLVIIVHLIFNYFWKPKYSLPHCLPFTTYAAATNTSSPAAGATTAKTSTDSGAMSPLASSLSLTPLMLLATSIAFLSSFH